jgi:hypothetical protein
MNTPETIVDDFLAGIDIDGEALGATDSLAEAVGAAS